MRAVCVVGLNGASGIGKTTLIEKTLPGLLGAGLSVGVLKHVHHDLAIDTAGKDTDRFYKAGAEFVFAHDSSQAFARFPERASGLELLLDRFPRGLDLVLVEGHKGAEIPAVRLHSGEEGKVHGREFLAVLDRNDPHCADKFIECLMSHLNAYHASRALRAGLLVGGKSTRMGAPKAFLEYEGEALAVRCYKTLKEITDDTVLVGEAELPAVLAATPKLPDAPGLAGPIAGILSASRWDPECTWIISALDMPLMDVSAWKWLLDQRRPGVWAILPCPAPGAKAETTAGCYEPEIFDFIESLACEGVSTLQEVARHPKVLTPRIPEALASCWKNVNTPREWKEITAVKDRKG